MKAGIDKSTKSELVTFGLYRYSRNLIFVGMDSIFIGTGITNANFFFFLDIVTFHLQILQEEKHMDEMFIY